LNFALLGERTLRLNEALSLEDIVGGLSLRLLEALAFLVVELLLGEHLLLLKTGDELLAWTRMEKRSRVVGIIVGHGCYEDPNFLTLLSQSIRWTAKR
jgi:hypothetical protein